MKQQVAIPLNKSVLIWARNSIGLSVHEAAEKLKLEQSELEKIEKGRKTVDFELLLKMSAAYVRPVAAFLLKDVPEEKPNPQDFRTINSDQTGHFHNKTIVAFRKARGLLKAAIELQKEMQISIPVFNTGFTLQDNAETVAQSIRMLFQVQHIASFETPIFALEWLIDQFEQKGIFVFQLSLTQDNIRGFSITDDDFPIIVLKRGSEQATAKIFTLFHELGHILINQGGVCDLIDNSDTKQIEKWCNHFAGAVLVPMNELKQNETVRLHIRLSEGSVWKGRELQGIASGFNIGQEVVLRRLLMAGLTSNVFYNKKHEQWSKGGGFATNPPKPDPVKRAIQERGKRFTRIALTAYENQKISQKDLSNYLDIKLENLHRAKEFI